MVCRSSAVTRSGTRLLAGGVVLGAAAGASGDAGVGGSGAAEAAGVERAPPAIVPADGKSKLARAPDQAVPDVGPRQRGHPPDDQVDQVAGRVAGVKQVGERGVNLPVD